MINLPPGTFERFISGRYLDAYVDGEFCVSAERVGEGYKVDVGCEGSVVEFHGMSGEVVAVLPLETWKLVRLG